MDTKKPNLQKPSASVKRAATGVVVSRRAVSTTPKFDARKTVAPKKVAAPAVTRVVMDPLVKPRHFSTAAIRRAVRRVAAG